MSTRPLFRTLSAMMLGVCLSQGPAHAQSGFTSLFDGRSFDGWVLPEGVDAANFIVQDGAIAISGTSGWVHTEKMYGDFTLKASVRFVKGEQLSNSGIFMRSPEDSRFAGRWPGKSFEIEARDMAANTNLSPPWIGQVLRLGGDGGRAPDGVATYNAAEALKAFRPGDWNDFEVIAHGTRIWTFLNGIHVSTVEGVDHPRGHIGFQAETGGAEWRNISIREHAVRPATAALLTADLAGWKMSSGPPPAYQDGVLTLKKDGAALRSAKAYGDFTLRFQYRLEDEGSTTDFYVRAEDNTDTTKPNDAVSVRLRSVSTARNGGPPGLVSDPRWPGAIIRTSVPLSGGLYDTKAALEAAAGPGVWRDAEIDVSGDEVVVRIGRRLISRARSISRPRGGHLILQPLEGAVAIRNLSIDDRMGE